MENPPSGGFFTLYQSQSTFPAISLPCLYFHRNNPQRVRHARARLKRFILFLFSLYTDLFFATLFYFVHIFLFPIISQSGLISRNCFTDVPIRWMANSICSSVVNRPKAKRSEL